MPDRTGPFPRPRITVRRLMAVVIVFALFNALPPLPSLRTNAAGLQVENFGRRVGFVVSSLLALVMGVVILLGEWIEAVLMRRSKTTDPALRDRLRHTIRLVLVLMLFEATILNGFARFAMLMSALSRAN